MAQYDSSENDIYTDVKDTQRLLQTCQYVNSTPINLSEDSKCCDRNTIKKRIPILSWLPQYSLQFLLSDFIAGVTVALTAIPQGIAYAVVAGLNPEYGLYSGFIGCFVYLILGTRKEITIGPTAIMALLTHEYVQATSPDYAVLLCFLTGCVILLCGVLHLGFLVEFISMPVTCGFTSAAAVTIAVSQIKSLLGLPGTADGFVDCLVHLYHNVKLLKPGDTALGLCTIITLIVLKKLKDNSSSVSIKFLSKSTWLLGVARNAVVVIIGSVLAYVLSTHGINPFRLTGNIGSGFPPFALPPFSTHEGNRTVTFVEMTTKLSAGIIVVPLIGILESISIAKAFAKGKTVDATQEMIALGVSNILGSFFSSIPVTGSFTRTAVNSASGVKTPFGGIFTGILILMSLGFLTSTFYYIPKATLAGVIMCAMFYMVEHKAVTLLWRTKKSDLIPLFTTFGSCLMFGLEIGMLIGITVNLLFILYSSARPSVAMQWITVDGENVLLVTPRESLVFPATEYVREVIVQTCTTRDIRAPVVLDGSHVNHIDSTMAKGMKVLTEDLAARKQPVYFWKWCEPAMLTAVGYDPGLASYFRYDESLVLLIKGPELISASGFVTVNLNGTAVAQNDSVCNGTPKEVFRGELPASTQENDSKTPRKLQL